ncbi:sigma-70 family RNA polymerase sigma factor [Microbacterium betulae]|uniref:Sigma-70 family RNA polymerase sigma factor n=1 Tax=Microbacterium betulae TaxID=2981139 RepID=A0AA97FJX2_9MICO|nr:sigma-70 family RNA polymerase sigma factor [Microbacterium sp. AB]WOF24653.1 sigma-70 family RNA polymerase sigma factor [Microbacterium sp. AB]
MRRRQVFSDLFASYYALIVRYVERRVWNRAIAEEIASETFEVVWQKLDPEDPPGLPWLYRTAAFKISNHRAREEHRLRADAALQREAAEAADPGDDGSRMDMRRAIGDLPDREREAIALTYWEGLSALEVAEVLDCSVAAVWKLLSRARARLRTALSEDADASEGRSEHALER